MSTTPTAPADAGPTPDHAAKPRRRFGVGAVLITVYAILAIGATSRAVVQMATVYPEARIPITLSAVSAVIYIVATLALILPGRAWYRIAWITISIELVGVLVVGTLSYVDTAIFTFEAQKAADGAVWSYFGIGYLYIPVVLPILGMIWLRSRRGQSTHRLSPPAEV
ncbi:MAG TPA: hypothetical protein VHZ81_01440 [Galbitalea sp.]|nr:hypothetical protein [Galbitalea sp.]